MSKKRGRYNYEPFVKLTRNIIESEAWLSLSNGAVRIYLEIRRRYNGQNNGEISLSCREAAKVAHCGKGTACKKFFELIEHGFIKVNDKGIFTYRNATTWVLTNEIYKIQSPTNEWKAWSSKTQDSP